MSEMRKSKGQGDWLTVALALVGTYVGTFIGLVLVIRYTTWLEWLPHEARDALGILYFPLIKIAEFVNWNP